MLLSKLPSDVSTPTNDSQIGNCLHAYKARVSVRYNVKEMFNCTTFKLCSTIILASIFSTALMAVGGLRIVKNLGICGM